MKITSRLIKKALYFGAEKHDKQYRKGGNVPYIVHPVMVAWGVGEYSGDEELVAAALLHDTLEDCKSVSFDLLKKNFGEKVANLVREVSFLEGDKKREFSWKENKELYLKKIDQISNEALIIIAVDKMTNMQGYFDALQSGENMAAFSFNGTPDEYRWYYNEIGNILASKLQQCPIVTDYLTLLHLYK